MAIWRGQATQPSTHDGDPHLPVWKAQDKASAKVLKKQILRNKEIAYLGYFHKMAQDFCPYF